MQIQKTLVRLCLALLAVWLGACQAGGETGTPTLDPKVVLTAAAQTAIIRLTQAAGQVSATPTTSPASPTPELALTAAFATVAAQLTQTAQLTPSPQPTLVSATPTLGQSNLAERAEFVADITIPDGTDFKPGEGFTKTWRLKNSGASTWTTAYTLTFISGDKMGGPDRVNIPSNVQPGGTVDVSVSLAAPAQAGRFRGYWKILSASGKFVDDAVYVEIDVIQGGAVTTPGTPTATTPAGNPNITNISMSVDNNTFTGACPRTFTFTGRFTLDKPAAINYQLEAGTDTPGFTFNLPPPQTNSYPAGDQALTFTLEFTQSVNGWLRLHITSPVDVTSNQATFSLTCQP